MKRLIFSVLLVLTLAGAMLWYMPRDFADFAKLMPSGALAEVYCRVTCAKNRISVGNGYIVQCRADELCDVLDYCRQIDGVSFRFAGDSAQAQRLAARLGLSYTNVRDIAVWCGKCNRVKGGVLLDGKTVNVQLAYRDGVITVGSPLILGSY